MLTLSSQPTISKTRCATQCQSVACLPADTSCYTTNGTAIIVSTCVLLHHLFFAPVSLQLTHYAETQQHSNVIVLCAAVWPLWQPLRHLPASLGLVSPPACCWPSVAAASSVWLVSPVPEASLRADAISFNPRPYWQVVTCLLLTCCPLLQVPQDVLLPLLQHPCDSQQRKVSLPLFWACAATNDVLSDFQLCWAVLCLASLCVSCKA